ncbi:MAG TPA: hypothetical protein VKQ32_04900 [Polyangia bacterium]|nr:hypothetical protein [Polyangia bacterium]
MSRGTGRWLPLLIALIGGCATVRWDADKAFESHQYVQAAELYDRALQEDKDDEKARAGRQRARTAALRELLEQSNANRRNGDASSARDSLGRFFRLRRRWFMSTPPELVGPLKKEAADAFTELAQGVQPLLDGGAPLAAEARLKEERGIVGEPELREARAELLGRVRALGQRRCEALLPTATNQTPFWGWLVGAYCQHFGRDERRDAALPFTVSGLDVRGDLSATSPRIASMMRDRLSTALQGTPWYGSTSPDRFGLELAGRYDVDQRHGPAPFEVPWQERVAYWTTETRQVATQVSYTAYVSESVSVPYTATETESYSCGSGTNFRMCTRSKMVTRTRTEQRTRPQIRFRTEYHPVTQPVRRYRMEPRVFRYQAERYDGSFAITGRARVSLFPGEPALEIPIDHRQRVSALWHDVTFEPASIAPVHARLPTPDEWIADRMPQIVTDLRAKLTDQWGGRFCRLPRFGPEEAARCLYGGVTVAAAAGGFREVAGPEADALAGLAVATASRRRKTEVGEPDGAAKPSLAAPAAKDPGADDPFAE